MIIRQATPAAAIAIAKVHVDTWRSTYRGIIPDEILDRLSYESRQQTWEASLRKHRSTNHTYVIEADGGNVVGFVSAGKTREGSAVDTGEIYAIYLLKDYQGRGWGKRLFLTAAERLAQAGYRGMQLWVLADNPTRGFYEAMGGNLSREKEIEIGGERLLKVEYEWGRLHDPLAE